MNETKIPLIGLGTWRLQGKECEKTVETALELGYRHIDTADVYQNHTDIRKAIRKWPQRELLFITTKLSMHHLLPDSVRASVPRFLDELGLSYLDLLLIHWPNPDVDMIETLKTMLEFKKQGVVKAIGVSNFVRFHLEEIAKHKIPILTNQIEMHPYLQRRSLVALCKELGIIVTAYRPLARGAFEIDPVLKKIGEKYKKSPSQIVLRWLIQQDIVAIPKASNVQHLKDNINVFDFNLDAQEMQNIDALDSNQRFCAPGGFPIYED